MNICNLNFVRQTSEKKKGKSVLTSLPDIYIEGKILTLYGLSSRKQPPSVSVISILCICPLIDDKLCHNIVKVTMEP